MCGGLRWACLVQAAVHLRECHFCDANLMQEQAAEVGCRPLYIDGDGIVHDWVPLFFVSFVVIAGSP